MPRGTRTATTGGVSEMGGATLLFAVGSAALALLSRRSLRYPRSHGFCRFFVLEAILALFALNSSAWFPDPLAPAKLLSWLLLIASVALVVPAAVLLHRRGHPVAAQRAGPELRFERTSVLVTTGIYRWIRHPMYASLLCLAWGVCLKRVTWLTLGLAVVTTLFVWVTALAEERENLMRFGSPYRTYMINTRRFIPFLW